MTKELTDLRYVAVEMLERDATKDSKPAQGLFRGILSRSLEKGEKERELIYMFLLSDPSGDKHKVKGFDASSFNVMTIFLQAGDSQELVAFKADDQDQKLAFEFLAAIVTTLQSENRMVDNDADLIDIDTYKDIPKELLEKEKDSKPVGNTAPANSAGGTGFRNNEYWRNDYYRTPVESHADRQKRLEKEKKMRETPAVIKRKSELPTIKQLNKMKKMIAQIAKGDVKEPTESDQDKNDPAYPDSDDFDMSPWADYCWECTHATPTGRPNMETDKCKNCNKASNFDELKPQVGKKN